MKKPATARIIIILCAAVSLLTAVCGCSGGSAQIISEGKVDNIRWALDDSGCLSFTGSGALPGVEYTLSMETGLSQTVYPEWYDFRDRITMVVVGSGIDSISMNAFMNFPVLRQIDFSATVNRIDGYAVTGCPALERVVIRCADVEMEKYCIGYIGGAADSTLADVTFAGIAGSQTEEYARGCGAKFSRL